MFMMMRRLWLDTWQQAAKSLKERLESTWDSSVCICICICKYILRFLPNHSRYESEACQEEDDGEDDEKPPVQEAQEAEVGERTWCQSSITPLLHWRLWNVRRWMFDRKLSQRSSWITRDGSQSIFFRVSLLLRQLKVEPEQLVKQSDSLTIMQLNSFWTPSIALFSCWASTTVGQGASMSHSSNQERRHPGREEASANMGPNKFTLAVVPCGENRSVASLPQCSLQWISMSSGHCPLPKQSLNKPIWVRAKISPNQISTSSE